MLRQVAQTVWDRLHLYERQVQLENARLDAAFHKAAQPVERVSRSCGRGPTLFKPPSGSSRGSLQSWWNWTPIWGKTSGDW
jgi:hypothetical protein